MNHKITVIGLGYVGLPLARLFATKFPVVGFDINQKRVAELKNGHDDTLEVSDELLKSVLLSENPSVIASEACHPEVLEGSTAAKQENNSPTLQLSDTPTLPSSVIASTACHPEVLEGSTDAQQGLYITDQISDITDSNIYIITVPTPVDKNNRPVLTPLIKASETVGKVIKKGDIVIYESTVYPGATEEDCIPVVEKTSGLKYNEDFFAGYSPERINPGDKEHTVEKILKVTSGSTPEIGKVVDEIYKSVITAGTHLAPTIKVAEAAKVIENSQRDINIAFVNELAKIFNLMEIDTHAVLEAAGTKWNFLPFKPGLVGGHCIGVDPYYLAQKAQEYGYHPEIILAGRRLNDSMGKYVAEQVIKAMIKKNISVNGAEVLMLGITFKENCPDVRNTKIVDVIAALEDFGVKVTTFDPWANPDEVKHEYGVESTTQMPKKKFDAVVLGVAHKEFRDLDLSLNLKEKGVVYDVKGVLEESHAKL
ncbi:nucleotide sugar dehydrogenase [Chryseobacterium suipulveris]|uniref:Nucleotide sugar dehydrogenase n=1 Tax=Chryseobacterium suipulveris TaxID=2929800 RepID=A0ABY4BRX3_9FLAO|nr:nucleotide sugar dehydrogenase [Chryseobacterium suipulveris]UOE41519.1 nucleotide sugar dehydrogenase [Chryseobacterium suipulveris]